MTTTTRTSPTGETIVSTVVSVDTFYAYRTDVEGPFMVTLTVYVHTSDKRPVIDDTFYVTVDGGQRYGGFARHLPENGPENHGYHRLAPMPTATTQTGGTMPTTNPYDPPKVTEITVPPYRVGSKVTHVNHPEWGVGTVASITLGGVRVNFPEGPRGWTFKKDRVRIAYI